jgi:hypothetical protein
MTTETTVNGNTVFTDDSLTHRWLDAIGPDVCKFVEEFVNVPFSADDQMAGWLATLIEAGADESTVTMVAGSPGGEVIFKTDENDNDGINAQVLGEAFYLGSRYPTYFGTRFKVADADQTDVMIGLCITNATALANLRDGLYFRLVDESTTLQFVAEKDLLETVLGIATLTDGGYVTAEYLYLNNLITVYVNGVQVAQITDADPNFPDNEYLTPTIAILAGAAAAGTGKTLTVDWIRCIQVQAT